MTDDQGPEPDPGHFGRTLFKLLKVRHQQETLRFVFASAMDIFMTFLLLYMSAKKLTTLKIIESNPVARFFIDRWGIRGMVYFKFAMVAFVVVAAQIISMKRPEAAKWLLNGGSLLVAIIVVYSTLLLARNLSV